MTREFASENTVPSMRVDTRMISDALLQNAGSCALQQCDLHIFLHEHYVVQTIGGWI